MELRPPTVIVNIELFQSTGYNLCMRWGGVCKVAANIALQWVGGSRTG